MAANPLRSIAVLYRDAFGGLPAVTWLLCTTGFINRCGSMVVPFLSLYLKDEFGYSATVAGAFVSAYAVGAFAGSWLGGWLTDRLGPVRTQVATLAATGAWMLIMILVRDAWLLGAAMFVLGVLNDAFRPGSLTAVAISVEPALRRKALSLNRLAMNAGWAFGPTFGGYLAEVDFRLMFVANGATCGLAALWLATRLRHWNPAPPPRGAEDKREGQPFRDRHFLCVMAANVVVLIAFMQYFTTGTRYLEEHGGYSKSQMVWFLAINPVMIALFEMPIVHLLRGRKALPLVATGALIVGLGYLCMLLPLGAAAVAIAMVVVAGGELLQMPMLGAYVNDHAPPHARGAYNGAYGMSFCAGFVLAPLLGGAIYDAAGPTALWWSCGAFGIGASIAFAFAARHVR
ncbi:MAG TPA: MFS transporter [Planctomycetota bacterium]